VTGLGDIPQPKESYKLMASPGQILLCPIGFTICQITNKKPLKIQTLLLNPFHLIPSPPPSEHIPSRNEERKK